MEKAGVELRVEQRELAVGGLVEVLTDLRRIVSAWGRMTRALRDEKPDLLVLVDSPDFNLPLARRAKRLGVPVLYYISPQVWAWRSGRIGKIARRVDRMAVIFPFETEVYAGTDLPVEFVGHPLVDRLSGFAAGHSQETCRANLGLASEGPLVALLPGSRRNEVRDTLPLQLAAARALHQREPTARFAIAVAPSISTDSIDPVLRQEPLPEDLELSVIEGQTYELLRAADVALAKPGTATVEIALLGTPLVVAARVHPFTAFIGRRLIRVDSLTMPNLIAGDTVVPEFLQEEAEPERIAEMLQSLLNGPEGPAQRRAFEGVRERLGAGGAAARAADIVLEMLDGPPRS
jgi:lipid-A-disaccharide synthase